MAKSPSKNAIIYWLCFCTQIIISYQQVQDELFLTPTIKSGDIEKARTQAQNNANLTSAVLTDLKSYSGYFTIDDKTNSNLFFWFFPAQKNPENAPVVLWINELPGFSSLKGIFLETGPFEIAENNSLKERKASWTKSHSMLYIDAPVGSGFSFADDEKAYANNSDEEAGEIYDALKQFFTLFQEFQARELYLAGENYAATIISYTAKHIKRQNEKSDVKINLKGFIVGSPYLDIEQDMERAETLYSLGLIDEEQKNEFDRRLNQSKKLLSEGNLEEGTKIGWSTIVGPDSLFQTATGFADIRSALKTTLPADERRFQEFVYTKHIQNYLHPGLQRFIDVDLNVTDRFKQEFIGSHQSIFQEMLDGGCRVLVYAAQFDIMITESSVRKILLKLKWKGAEEYAAAPRKIWKVNEDVAGYVKSSNSLTYATVRNAGNFAIRDQPEFIADLVEKFTYNKEF